MCSLSPPRRLLLWSILQLPLFTIAGGTAAAILLNHLFRLVSRHSMTSSTVFNLRFVPSIGRLYQDTFRDVLEIGEGGLEVPRF
jgi:hypothetical protein